MGKRRLLALGLIVLAGAAVAVPLAANAGDPRRHPFVGDETRLVLTERMQLTAFNPATGAGTQAGTFVSAGAINDAGSAAATFMVVPGRGTCGTLEGTHVMTSANGTLSIHTEAVACPFPPGSPPRSFVRGNWWVMGGTGAYAGVSGDGRVYATGDFATGVITIARDGAIGRH